jgi:16S rRNA (guanine527-N7)-methyltransferase
VKDILINGAQTLGVDLDNSAVENFETYFQLLEETNKVMNLTAISGREDVARLHFLDCMALLKIADFSNASVIDIGSGAGFPGFPIAIADRSVKLTTLDAQQKRIGFLSKTAQAIGREDINCIHARAEEAALTPMRESFDYAVSRAVARLNVLCELCLPFVKIGGAMIAMKSVDTEEEIDQAKPAIKTLGGKIEKVSDYPVPGTDIIHRAVVIRKIGKTPKGYPRRFAKIQKSPL